jgi:putative N6-adenine-specific DNA methylase
VCLTGGLHEIARLNLHLRVASRVIVRLGGFHARALGELERRAEKLEWARYLQPGQAVSLRVTTRKSRLYHHKAIAERVGRAIRAVTGADPAAGTGDHEAESDDRQLVLVRLLRDECQVSMDSSGPLLHKRGYRLATAKAPLRETMAAAMLMAMEWTGDRPLLDPFCGSGTIVIEAALLARRVAPGLERRFAFEGWPGFDPVPLARLREEARAVALPGAAVPIIGSDRDAGAIRAAAANAERAGVSRDLSLTQRPLSGVERSAERGLLLTNPPYGVRVGERDRLLPLYAALGQLMRDRLRGWSLAMLVPPGPLVRATQLPVEERFATVNGGLEVNLMATGTGRS